MELNIGKKGAKMVESTGEDFNCGFYFDEEEADKTEGRTYVEMVPASKWAPWQGRASAEG